MTVGCIVKTFIIYDMCKGEQIGIFAKSEEFRRIVHKEMYGAQNETYIED